MMKRATINITELKPTPLHIFAFTFLYFSQALFPQSLLFQLFPSHMASYTWHLALGALRLLPSVAAFAVHLSS